MGSRGTCSVTRSRGTLNLIRAVGPRSAAGSNTHFFSIKLLMAPSPNKIIEIKNYHVLMLYISVLVLCCLAFLTL